MIAHQCKKHDVLNHCDMLEEDVLLRTKADMLSRQLSLRQYAHAINQDFTAGGACHTSRLRRYIRVSKITNFTHMIVGRMHRFVWNLKFV